MAEHKATTQAYSLQHATSLVFALTAIIPLLIFTYSLVTLGALTRTTYQVSLFLALCIAMAGFVLFRMIVSRMVDLLGAASGAPARAPSVNDLSGSRKLQVPGLGTIREFRDLQMATEELGGLWKAEAARHVGRRVVVAVRAGRPVHGTLLRVTDAGLVVDAPSGGTLDVPYSQVAGIKSDTPAT